MSSLSVRAHLPVESGGPVGLRGLQETEIAAGNDLGPSVRELLPHLRSHRLAIGGLRYQRGNSPIIDRLLDLVGQLTDARSTQIRVRLELWVDGEYERSVHARVDDSGTYTFERDPGTVLFRDRVVLRLYEANLTPYMAHPQVALLQRTQGNTPRTIHTVVADGGSTASFSGTVGTYEVDCAVTTFNGRAQTATEMIESFRRRTDPGAWWRLDRATLADELEATIANPELVRQGPTPLCGPASVIYALAKRAPRRYVRIVTQLYERGAFETKGGKIEASPNLRDTLPPRTADSETRQVDWILASAMRNSQNHFFAIEGSVPPIAGVTVTSEMMIWTRELLGYERFHVSKATATAELGFNNLALFGVVGIGILLLDSATGLSAQQALADAKRALDSGGEAYMMINATLLQGARTQAGTPTGDPLGDRTLWQSILPNIATHWIAIRAHGPGHPINIDHGGEVTFDAFTWGHYLKVRVAEQQFQHNTFLVVTAHEGPTS